MTASVTRWFSTTTCTQIVIISFPVDSTCLLLPEHTRREYEVT
jgi:hypothetical protein